MAMSARRLKRKMQAPKLPSTDPQFDKSFELLAQAIHEIHRKNASNLSYEELYRNAYIMVLQKRADTLYNGVKEVISDHLELVAETEVIPAFVKTTDTNARMSADAGTSFLMTLKRVWNDHTTSMIMIRDILMYMDKKHVKPANMPLVYDMGLELFRDKVIRSQKHPIQAQLTAVLLDQIKMERRGEQIDRSAIKAAVDMLVELYDQDKRENVYVVDFEPHFLETSSAFYLVESQALLAECDASEYMRKIEKRMNEEYNRTRHYLSPVTEPKIRNIVETQLITNHAKTIMEMENSGLRPMLAASAIEDLSRMYKLFSRVPEGLNEMRTYIKNYVLELGNLINAKVDSANDTTKPKEKDGAGAGDKPGSTTGSLYTALRWVQDILELQEKFNKIIDFAVLKDKSFQTAVNEAFETFINANPRSPEYISLFIDENLKKGLKGKTEEEVDNILDHTITLFRFIREKDVFERYYKQHLAKRLLFGRSVSDDAERSMITKLKVECGYQFTTKLEGMFNDIRISADTVSAYKDYLDASGIEKPKIDMASTILTSTFWPMSASTSPKWIMPAEITDACQSFEKFYYGRHNGRRLTWQPNMGTADIKASFNTKRHDLNVSTYGMAILLLFNEVPDEQCLTTSDIQAQTDINDIDLRRTLQSLACGKYKVLIKEPKGKEVDTTDKFYLNVNFTCPLARIKIQTVATKVETESERKTTHEKVDKLRKHQIEAAIVRIMKDRKTMDHNLLIAEVVKQLSNRFNPSPQMIKKRIEELIDREYLERNAGDRKSYNYLA
ncbi:Cullin [Umbelopsis sp. AD052]|nr:Cullin [Umbelopsis sp. AD052]